MRLMKWLAVLAAVSGSWCLPAQAQKTSDLPSAATLTGTEQVAMSQGSGCASHSAPCASVKATLSTISTFANASLDTKLVNIAALSPSADTCFYFTSSTAVSTYTCNSSFRAGSAVKWITGRTIAITGDLAYTSPSLDGSGNVTAAGTLATVNSNVGSCGSATAIPVITLNAKGLATACSTAAPTGLLTVANNLSDVASAETARTNLLIPQFAHPGYVASRYYWPTGFMPQANTSIAPGAATLRKTPIFVPQRITISELFTRVVTVSAGGNLQLGIYAMDATTKFATGAVLASTGNISTTTANVLSAALGASIQLAPGWYWIGVMADNGTATVVAGNVPLPHASFLIGSTTLANVSAASTTNGLAHTYSVTFGTWPNLTSVSPTEVTTAEPLIGFKVSSVP